jgi:uncharacterized protein (DUF983 family)
MKLETKIVSGECPSCKELTMLVEVDEHFFRCITCGEDLEQKINDVPILKGKLKGIGN